MSFALVVLVALGTSPPVVAQETEPGWLAVIRGTVVNATEARLTVAADSVVVAFNDRPGRRIALVDLGAFVASAWGEGGAFRVDPPNASLVDETDGEIGVVEIVNAALSGGLLSLDLVILDGLLPAPARTIAITLDAGSLAGWDVETGNVY
jgi:hypothetical protein